MHKCNILIADDEMLAREAVKLQLKGNEGIEIVAECTNGKETFEMMIEHKPDIVFLDIQMPYFTGLEVLDKMDKRYSPYIIFISAYDSYALQAFENDAIDYLVKPFTDERFQKAFQKAYKTWKCFLNDEAPLNTSINELKKVMQIYFLEEKKQTISIKDGSRIFLIHLEEVSHIEAAGNYVTFFTKEKKYLHKETMQTLEVSLPSAFVRIHKSSIVNTAFIKEFHSLLNGDYVVKLKTGQELKLTRNYRSRIAHLL